MRYYAALLTIALAGCASLVGDKDIEAALKLQRPNPAGFSVYVCRQSALLPVAGVNVHLDGENIGSIKPGEFLHALVSPGRHRTAVRNPFVYSGDLWIEGRAGDIAYVWVGVTGHGWGTLTVDHFDSPAAAGGCVTQSRYIAGQKTSSYIAAPAASAVPIAVFEASRSASAASEKIGQDSPAVERLLEVRACNAAPRAISTAKGPGFEAYRVACSNGDTLLVRCEMGNCRVLK